MRRGFTLIELIMVLAVIAILLGMLMPSLATVRASGRSVACISNLRQMSIAARGYALEYHYYPPAIRYEFGDVPRLIGWDWVTTMEIRPRVISPGPLWSFTDNPRQVQQCPDYHGTTNFAETFTGYNYNTTYVGGEGRFPNQGWDHFRPGIRHTACRRVATVALFGDGGRKDSTNKFMRAPMNTMEHDLQGVYAGGQAFRHRLATNVAYLDGHVTSVKGPSRGALATDTLLDQFMGFPANGFLSDDDRAYDPR